MKIIGITKGNYLAELTSDELGRLTGAGRGYGDADSRLIDMKLQVRDAWDTIQALQCAKDDLPKIANKLRAMADLLEPIAVEIPVVEGQ